MHIMKYGSSGFDSPDNHTTHQAQDTAYQLQTMNSNEKENISSMSVYSSYAIFLNWKEPKWFNPGYVSEHIPIHMYRYV